MLAAFAICLVSVWTGEGGPIRIGLFRLFEPAQFSARVVSGPGAMLSAGHHSDTLINKDESVRVRREGGGLNVAVLDALGRTRRTIAASTITLTPLQTSALSLSIPTKITRLARGIVSASAPVNEGRHRIGIVLLVPREAAVAAVVAAELGPRQAGEAHKALAVLARTFLLAQGDRHREEGFDVCDTTHCQLYRGEDDLADPASAALLQGVVAATAGDVLRYNGRAVEGHYTAVCGGRTAAPGMVWGGATRSEYPYPLVACRWCAASPYRDWERRAAAASVMAALASATGMRMSPAAELVLQRHPSSEVVRSVIWRDRGRQVVLSGDEFRRALGRRLGWNRVLSPTFRVERRAGLFIFRGRGFGSQVGLCVAGAVAQAAAGRTYREILRFYFPGTDLTR